MGYSVKIAMYMKVKKCYLRSLEKIFSFIVPRLVFLGIKTLGRGIKVVPEVSL